MVRILYLPLDERPCNRLFPQMMAATCPDVELTVVPERLLGHKKAPADVPGIWSYLEKNVEAHDCVILSAEMLFFGGLLPSRLHQMSPESARDLLDRLVALRRRCPRTRFYLSQLIMRTPRYSSSDEEPDYYETWGRELYRRAYLADKFARQGLSDEERAELESLERTLPREVREDYERRRDFNLTLLERVIDLVDAKVVDTLFIPQDDSSEFGYTALDQRRIGEKIKGSSHSDHIFTHPGADEAGCELLARAYLDAVGRRPRVHVLYGTLLAPEIVPLYEDRPLGVSVGQHLLACGCVPCADPARADLTLAINAPGRVMEEARQQLFADATYRTFRCQPAFVRDVVDLVRGGSAVALADCAFANGGELELVSQLDAAGALDQLVSYKGWNTTCNTIGTSLAQGALACGAPAREALVKNVAYHVVDDALYQSDVRWWLERQLAELGLTYFDLGSAADEIGRRAAGRLQGLLERACGRSFRTHPALVESIAFPWNRLFEIEASLSFARMTAAAPSRHALEIAV